MPSRPFMGGGGGTFPFLYLNTIPLLVLLPRRLLACLCTLLLTTLSALADESGARALLDTIITEEGSKRDEAIAALTEQGDPIIKEIVEAWRVGEIVLAPIEPEGSPIALRKLPKGYEIISTGAMATPIGEPKKNRPRRSLRKTMKKIVDFLDLSSSDPAARIATVQKMSLSHDPKFLPILQERIEKQTDPNVIAAFEEAIAILLLANGTAEEKIASATKLGDMKSFPSRDLIEAFRVEAESIEGEQGAAMIAAAKTALRKIDGHQQLIEVFGTFFRGLSTGSVLLLVAYGLAITFGLMGVINMAHGEFIAIGGYTTFMVQGFFNKTFGTGTAMYETYFLWALPASFLAAAILGIVLERGVIQFLYKRPLESLLATWGVSMVMQQLFRFQFGPANVAVSSPDWLSGSFSAAGISMSYNRMFVVLFAIIVIIATWLLLTRTSWGLHVRATMQNREMASCLGVRSAQVNMLTFGFGSGLAGLAGAFLSQIGNVGPSMGQGYIVDSFMVVVIGGVGNLVGTAISSFGIGMVDQILQPILGPVMGKISVLFAIILFLQFKPGGLFPARSRSLDD